MRSILARMLQIGLLVFGSAALADDPSVITADEAFGQATAGTLTIIDVRTPAEWKQTGVIPGAQLIDVTQGGGAASFVDQVDRVTRGDKSRPIAVICRSGNRSAGARSMLLAGGYTAVRHIPDGMSGNAGGPGWIKRNLPTEPCPTC
ncbi:Rhodanese domain-containing protein [uncultured Gammaproteobacteria bacterium]